MVQRGDQVIKITDGRPELGTVLTNSGQGSYPAEMTADQSDWLHERAAERRKQWEVHSDRN